MLAIGALTDPRPSIDRCVSLSCPWATRVRCEPPPASTSKTTYWQLQSAVPWWGQGQLSGSLRAWRADCRSKERVTRRPAAPRSRESRSATLPQSTANGPRPCILYSAPDCMRGSQEGRGVSCCAPDKQFGGEVGGIRRTIAGCRLCRLERQFHRDPGAAARGRI